MDFALWKAAKPGEPAWDSPWGKGRPGWHIECSAMSLDILGEGFDLHGGGNDLMFPHHENERAQAEGAGHPFARHWIHSGMVTIGDEKMAKSAGNFVTTTEALDQFGPAAFRFAVLQTHYTRSMDLGPSELDAAAKGVERLQALVRRADAAGVDANGATVDDATVATFRDAMDDDFNTPNAMAAVFDAAARANRAIDDGDLAARGVARRHRARAHECARPRPRRRVGRRRRHRDRRPRAPTRRGARREGLRDRRRAARRAHRARHPARGHPGRHDLAPMSGRGPRDLAQQVEGRRAVRELLVANSRKVHDVWIAADVGQSDILDEITALAEAQKVKVRRVPGDQVDHKARTESPQGVVAFAAPVVPADFDALLADPNAFLVALDGVTDPQNLGAVLRTAETMGATGAVLPTHRAVGLSPAVTKAAAGALEYLRVAFVSGIPSALERAKRAGRVVGGPRRRRQRRRARGRRRRSAARARARRRGPRALAPRAYALRRDRVDPDAGAHRVAERQCGCGDCVRGDCTPACRFMIVVATATIPTDASTMIPGSAPGAEARAPVQHRRRHCHHDDGREHRPRRSLPASQQHDAYTRNGIITQNVT